MACYVDPVEIAVQLRKLKNNTEIVGVGPPKPKEEKKTRRITYPKAVQNAMYGI